MRHVHQPSINWRDMGDHLLYKVLPYWTLRLLHLLRSDMYHIEQAEVLFNLIDNQNNVWNIQRQLCILTNKIFTWFLKLLALNGSGFPQEWQQKKKRKDHCPSNWIRRTITEILLSVHFAEKLAKSSFHSTKWNFSNCYLHTPLVVVPLHIDRREHLYYYEPGWT